ncbi:hypothetical protein CANCADRAFT_55972 [Tortispora caseinolytica NRRL Y-17796]|uniref:Protein kinase domain-containing protein n=1 Tax=Tortispora caseinolytica NRRL Y-17796 TaxID=767744 RepID=A0A1E4TKK1_9ASCO|nr:hypothetical protein CANCADRAFT_55972 [Tortispora caseinolytica NRRL Y-17796]
MFATKGANILEISDIEFDLLTSKVAGCVSLLISHFDIMGARGRQKDSQQLEMHKVETDLSSSDLDRREKRQNRIIEKLTALEAMKHESLGSNANIGRVLDDHNSDSHFLSFLSSSASNMSLKWQQGRYIGGGTFGSVYIGVTVDTGDILAVKEMRMQNKNSMRTVVNAIKDEMRVLEMLSHPNIIQYYGIEVHVDKVYIFMEYCDGGSLADLLAHGRIEDELVIKVYVLQMLQGLAYLHQAGIVHRDVKPGNILLDHNGVVKIVDFGAAKVLAQQGRTLLREADSPKQSLTGTPMYMSPEIITGRHEGFKRGSEDIWSLGCCLIEMCTGRQPWDNLDNEWAIMYHIATGHQPVIPTEENLSKMGLQFLAFCFDLDPNTRPGALDLLKHPWLSGVSSSTE